MNTAAPRARLAAAFTVLVVLPVVGALGACLSGRQLADRSLPVVRAEESRILGLDDLRGHGFDRGGGLRRSDPGRR